MAFARSCFLFYCGCLSSVALPFLYQNMVNYLVDVRGCDITKSLDTSMVAVVESVNTPSPMTQHKKDLFWEHRVKEQDYCVLSQCEA